MKKRLLRRDPSRALILCCLIAGVLFFNFTCAFAQDLAPVLNKGEKWRIAMYEGGEYVDYQRNFIGLLNGLKNLGWVENKPLPAFRPEQTKEIWAWLAKGRLKSDYIEFVADAHYSASWDKQTRTTMRAAIIQRLAQKKDIDLIIATGTWAGQDLANNQHTTPVVVISCSDAVASKIIISPEDSGLDHVHARIDPERFERQVRIFHDILGFKTLGVAYEDSLSGRSISAIEKVRAVANEREFEVVECHSKNQTPSRIEAEKSVSVCYQDLMEKVDAIYVTTQNGVNDDSLPGLIAMFNERQIPTFSQYGSKQVEKGILMSISSSDLSFVGNFYAETIAKIFNGIKPRDISQIFEAPPKIAINLNTARIIGYDPPIDVLSAADEIFQE
jgi:ABC-type uncharacterized transport system substrate-binding protein